LRRLALAGGLRMRAVADTNVVVSGLLWHGPPRRVLDLARAGSLTLFTSPALVVELEEVLGRAKFARRLAMAETNSFDLSLGYAALAHIVRPDEVPPVIAEDPDDDEVLACAVAARADLIISGDSHLLGLGEYREIRIVSAADFLAGLSTRPH
jgi:uncharacterized protein